MALTLITNKATVDKSISISTGDDVSDASDRHTTGTRHSYDATQVLNMKRVIATACMTLSK